MNAAQHRIINLLTTFFCSSVLVSVGVFNVWPKPTLLPPVWPGGAKRLDALSILFPEALGSYDFKCKLSPGDGSGVGRDWKELLSGKA